MPASEVTQWQAYERVAGPFGGERGDVQAALTAYYVVTALGSKKAKLDKMVPQWDRPPKQDWRDMSAALEALTRSMGGTVERA